MNSPLVSVIVLNYNGAGLLPECLSSLSGQDWPNLEIIVADNASHDNSREVTESCGAHFHAMDRNYGFSYTNDHAAAAANGDFLFFVNNDMKFDASCISRMMGLILADDRVFSADPKQLDWAGNKIVHHALRFAPGTFFHRSILPWVDIVPQDGPIEVPFGCAGAMLARKSMFDQLGGFDKEFLFDFEDVDLSWRAWLKGWKTVHVPEALVYHKICGTFKTVANTQSDVAGKAAQDFTTLRMISGQKNYLRFILKTMSPGLVSLVLVRELLRIAGHAVLRHKAIAYVRLRAFATVLKTLPAIMRARKLALDGATTDSRTLIKRFMVRT
ncbi:MAG: glycosyltransferase family 2 protein [Candidatus Eisenbacteria bacterium]